jgi:hypothetical protein
MDKIFASKPGRRRFLFTILLLITLLSVLRFSLFPIKGLSDNTNATIITFLQACITSVSTAVIVGYFLYWIQGEETKKQIDFTESGSEIEKKLKEARTKTDIWLFNGGLGRYTKSDTMPKLSENALADRKTIIIKIIVLNPFNKELLKRYISFRISVEDQSKKSFWTELVVQSEILSTIITALYYKKNNQLLDITIKIKDFFTLSRMDIGSNIAIITREDPTIPSIILKKESYMYKHYTEEFQQADRQSHNLDYFFPNFDKPTKDEVEACLTQLFPNEVINPTLLETSYEKFKNPTNPFK